ncbi:MAG: hypothetical protein IPK76_09355 [Lewinellaceae bacterium]|nr:hypothetical protein [Lewinellaceae bacterium]
MKNYLTQVLYLSLLVLLLLTGLSLVPENTMLGDFQLRRMDIFADIRGEDAPPDQAQEKPPPDSLFVQADTLPSALQDTAEATLQGPFPAQGSADFGRILEDYTFEQHGLNRFF